MPWNKKSGFRLVPREDVLRLTGLEPLELLQLSNTQQLTRVDKDGKRVELVRVPIELLLEGPAD